MVTVIDGDGLTQEVMRDVRGMSCFSSPGSCNQIVFAADERHRGAIDFTPHRLTRWHVLPRNATGRVFQHPAIPIRGCPRSEFRLL